MSRSTSQTSSSTTTTTNDLSRSLSLKTNIKAAVKANPLPASDIKLYLTNLRLLDLDLRPDWPNISVQTFSSKNADQKQRIDGVEWTLFRLFEIWDPEETAQKLNPFFPPLEPLQSRNLRAALYRSLNELKKNGILGRESVLRKTMLDECKGEKFYELLALFSNAVLKKVLASRDRKSSNMAVARKLATATMLSNDKQQSLLPLAIAHKAALVNVLRRKEEKRKKFAEFEEMLHTKGDDIHRRIAKCKGTPRAKKPAISQKEADAVKKQLKHNWIGNQQWLEVILHGDDIQAQDVFLNSSFNTVWRMLERGFKLQDAPSEAGLLENLQSRVQEQQSRLEKWRQFHERFQTTGTEPSKPAPIIRLAVKDFNFEDHLQLQLRSSKEGHAQSIARPPLGDTYRDIIADMDEELAGAAKAKYNRSSVPQLRRRTSSQSNPRSPARTRKLSRSGSTPHVPTSPGKNAKIALRKKSRDENPTPVPHRPTISAQTPLDSEATLVGAPSTRLHSTASASHSVESLVEQREFEEDESSDPLPTITSPPQPATVETEPQPPTPETTSYYPSEPPIPILEPPQLTQEEAMAEQIISSIGNATPSPVKKPQPRLSLMERTRLSMAHHSHFDPVPESPSLDSPPLPLPPTIEPVAEAVAEADAEPDRRATLLERTRLSMAAMTNKPRASLAPHDKPLDKRKSSRRSSLFPVNQFDTPRNRKSFEAIEEAKSGERTPKEDLFADEADYDRVFKSRPRIATSPVFSPSERDARHMDMLGEGEEEEFDEGVTGVDLGDVDADYDEEDGFTRTWENSPSRRAGRMR